MRRIAAALFLLLLAPAIPRADAQTRPITERDLFDFHWIGDMQLAPDGRHAVYVQAQVKEDRSGYETSLYLLDLTIPNATPQLLLAGTHDTTPRWSPDSTRILFLRAPEQDGKPQPAQLYTLTLFPTQGSPRAITTAASMPKGVSQPAWSGTDASGGSTFTVLAQTLKVPAPQPPKPKPEHVSDLHIITENPRLSNGDGYIDRTVVPQLYRIAENTGPEQLTSGPYGIREYVSADPDTLLFLADRSADLDEKSFPHNQIYALRTDQSHTVTLIQQLPFEAHNLAVAPHQPGQPFRIAFHAAPYPDPPAKPLSHIDTDLFTLEVDLASLPATAKPIDLTLNSGYEMGGSVGGDNTAPRGNGRPQILFSPDGQQLLDTAASKGSAYLVAVTPAGVQPLTAPRQAVLNFATTPDHATTLALISNPILIGDLFRIDPAAHTQTQLTHSNDALFSQLNLKQPENFQVKPTHRPQDIPNQGIDTFVQLPPNFDPTRHYPTILNIHGGPHSAYGWVFDHEMLLMAARGYVTIYPNPRGSTTYGSEFANVIENKYPGDDFHDLMDTVDAAIAKGWSDPARLGVTGGSGGGLLTDWTVTQTDRFKAAVAQRDIVDAAAWWYTADIGDFHQYWWPTAPFASPENLKIYHDHSPLTFVNNVKTPMMFILGESDSRTPPPAGGEAFFRALTYRKVPAVMVFFPRENHELSRSGEPWHRVERLQNITNWFDAYLLGTCEPLYPGKVPCSTKTLDH